MHLLLNKNINKSLTDAIYNNLNFKFYNNSIHSNFKIYRIKSIIVKEKFATL